MLEYHLEYNGISWSVGGAMNRSAPTRGGLAGGGTQTDALATIGNKNAVGEPSEEYDGTSWSNGGCQITPAQRDQMGAASTGAAVVFGGMSAGANSSYLTEEYNKSFAPPSKDFIFSQVTGETTVSCLIETSAARYKDNIQPMGSQLNKVMQLKPVEFDWKSNKKHDIGFVADSVKNVYPNLVSEKDGQVEGMNYSKLVSALVKSIQEQQTQIDELKTRLDNNN